MKKRSAILYTLLVLILGLVLNFLFELMPDEFKSSISAFSNSIGLSYTIFWIICTFFLAGAMIYFVWEQTLNEPKELDPNKQTGSINRQVNQYGEKSIYLEKNNGDINVN